MHSRFIRNAERRLWDTGNAGEKRAVLAARATIASPDTLVTSMLGQPRENKKQYLKKPVSGIRCCSICLRGQTLLVLSDWQFQ